jgi:hypothetical protein
MTLAQERKQRAPRKKRMRPAAGGVGWVPEAGVEVLVQQTLDVALEVVVVLE